jgi:hypothetical protein
MRYSLALMYRDSLNMFIVYSRGTGIFGSTYINEDNFLELFKVLGLSIFDKICSYWQKIQRAQKVFSVNIRLQIQ